MPDDDEFAEFDFDEEEFEMKDDGRGGGKKQQQQVGSIIQSQGSVKFTSIAAMCRTFSIFSMCSRARVWVGNIL